MGLHFVLDTNAIVYLQQGRLAHPLPEGDFFVSVVTEMELLSFPQLGEAEETAIRDFLADVTVIGISEEINKHAIRLRREHRLRLPDAIIGGTAIALAAALLTNDAALASVPGLPCQSLPLTT